MSQLQKKFLQKPADHRSDEGLVLQEGDPDYQMAVSSLKYQIKDCLSELIFIGMKPNAILIFVAGVYHDITS